MAFERSEQIANVAAALVAAQADLRDVKRDQTARVETKGGGSYSYDYADLATVLDAVRPVLAAHKLAVAQFPEIGPDSEAVAVTTLLLHESGEYVGCSLRMPCDTHHAQSIGSAITYGRRYGLQSVIGIATESDDDGQAAVSTPRSQPGPAAPASICPECGKGTLVERRRKSDGAPFWACDNNQYDAATKTRSGCRYIRNHPPGAEAEEPPAEAEGESEPPGDPNPAAVAVMDVLRGMGRETKAQQIAALGKACQALGRTMPTGNDPERWLSGLADEYLALIIDALTEQE